MWSYLFSLFFVFFIFLSSFFLFPISCLIWTVTIPFDKNLRLLHLYTSAWASMYSIMNPFWNLTIYGKEKIDRQKTYIIVANHQSIVDIFILFRLMIHFKWVSKIEIFKIPLIGWNMYLNRYIALNRENTKSQARMIQSCIKTVRQGSSVMIFPEGTRSLSRKMRKFKKGAFDIAVKTSAPILPIVIDGSSKAMPHKGIRMKGKHKISITVLDEILVGDQSSQQLLDLTYNKIAEQLELNE